MSGMLQEKSRGASGAVQVSEQIRHTVLGRVDQFLKSDRIERMAAPVIMAEILSIVDEK